MALVGPCNEVVTLGFMRGLHPPPPVGGLYDRDLSEASLAAAGAIADLQEQREPWSGVIPRDTTASTAGQFLLFWLCLSCDSVQGKFTSRQVSRLSVVLELWWCTR